MCFSTPSVLGECGGDNKTFEEHSEGRKEVMLVEKKLSEALKDFDNGKVVLVLTTMVDGSVCCDRLEDLFPEDTHFLVNVPAYVNPEFEAAAQNSVS